MTLLKNVMSALIKVVLFDMQRVTSILLLFLDHFMPLITYLQYNSIILYLQYLHLNKTIYLLKHLDLGNML